jgi:hypothetical protein
MRRCTSSAHRQLSRDRIAALRRRLAAVQAEALTLQPKGTEVWRSGIAVLTLQGEPRLLALHERVGGALSALAWRSICRRSRRK